MKCLRLMKMNYWAENAYNKWLFGHKLWNFMEQISNLLSNWVSWVCLLMKIRSAHAHFGMRRPLEAFELSASA
jgi:hypothetical protein